MLQSDKWCFQYVENSASKNAVDNIMPDAVMYCYTVLLLLLTLLLGTELSRPLKPRYLYNLISIKQYSLLFHNRTLTIFIACGKAVYATTFPSVCPSVTLRYCVKTREGRRMWSSPSGSPVSLIFCCQEWLVETTLSR